MLEGATCSCVEQGLDGGQTVSQGVVIPFTEEETNAQADEAFSQGHEAHYSAKSVTEPKYSDYRMLCVF